MSTILVCGYRRSGKDTFFRQLVGCDESVPPWNWAVYSQGSCLPRELSDSLHLKRLAFADPLKREVELAYGISPDEDKDVKRFNIDGNLFSARDLYKRYGTWRRLQDVDYWAKKTFEGEDLGDSTVRVVTDWRFPNEYAYVARCLMQDGRDGPLCVRLFSSQVEVPPRVTSFCPPPSNLNDPWALTDAYEEESEHNLDGLITDLLLVRTDLPGRSAEEEFQAALALFPQYTLYKRIV